MRKKRNKSMEDYIIGRLYKTIRFYLETVDDKIAELEFKDSPIKWDDTMEYTYWRNFGKVLHNILDKDIPDNTIVFIELYIKVYNGFDYTERLLSIQGAIESSIYDYARRGYLDLLSRINIHIEYYTNETLNTVMEQVKHMNEVHRDTKNYHAIIDDIDIWKSETNDNGM